MQDQRLAEERAAATRRAQQPTKAEVTLDFFFKALDRDGDWVHVERYGYCWQPRAAQTAGWRPYLDGHWVYTDHGWTWVSEESFGWATYHYGRWARVRRLGWVWVPGSEWAPAWVSWRRSDRYVGWAPLPPEAHSGTGFNAGVDSYYDIGPGSYSFVPVENFGAPTYVGRIVDPERNVSVIAQTENVTNTTYRQVDNRTVIFNGGPQYAAIKERADVRRMELERVSEAPAGAGPSGDVLRLLAPFIQSATKPAGEPARVRERVRAPEVERGLERWGCCGVGAGARTSPAGSAESRAGPKSTGSGGASGGGQTGKAADALHGGCALPVRSEGRPVHDRRRGKSRKVIARVKTGAHRSLPSPRPRPRRGRHCLQKNREKNEITYPLRRQERLRPSPEIPAPAQPAATPPPKPAIEPPPAVEPAPPAPTPPSPPPVEPAPPAVEAPPPKPVVPAVVPPPMATPPAEAPIEPPASKKRRDAQPENPPAEPTSGVAPERPLRSRKPDPAPEPPPAPEKPARPPAESAPAPSANAPAKTACAGAASHR